jgi:hypothetical protein
MPNEKITDWNITLEQVTEQIKEEVRGSVDKYFDYLQKTISSHPMSGTELGEQAKDCAKKNIAIARDYMHKLSRAKDFMELVPIQTEFMRSQLDSFGEQIKTLGQNYTKAATEMLNSPLRKAD